MTLEHTLTQGLGVRCLSCRCELEVTQEYGADVRCCPRCGGLWMGRRGLHRLRTDLHQKRLDTGLTWGELGALLDDDGPAILPKPPFHPERGIR